MPQFIYTAMDGNGKEQKGKIEAASEDAASSALKAKGLFPTSLKPAVAAVKKGASTRTGKKKGGGMNMALGPVVIKRKELTVVTRQLAILLSAGLPLIRSLHTLERQAKNPAVKIVLGKTAETVEGGATFAEALAQHPRSFDKLYLNMVRAGEASGAMEIILDRLASFMEKAARISGKVKSAMIYPCVVLTIALLAVVGLMIFIVPNFQKIFTELLGPNEPLPDITLLVMGISNTLVSHWYYYVGGVVGVIALYQVIVHIPAGKWGVDWCKYNMPLFGPIISKTAISRFSRTLGTLMSSGVPVLNALSIVKETSGNETVASAIQKVHDAVKEGEGIAKPLSGTKIFPEMVISMVEVGEETGKLPEMLDKIANTYDEEVDNAVSALTSMIEPLMIVLLAVIVGGIVIALFLPLTKIIEKLS
ncbi:type II secretion system F family protein [Victivallis vadensis]|jgi:type II secretion system F domain protein|uniref:type II secretion system F family protein n=2 Tax=Victivallis vadensis TaxID=172901 RepID=UPI00266BF535|nr:type II secretion system F family protein [Victivallis vadensis]